MAQSIAVKSPTPAADHPHRWRIPEPNGPGSVGV